MTDEEFDEHVAATEKRVDGTVGGLDYCLLKLSAEVGEVAGLRGKEILRGEECLAKMNPLMVLDGGERRAAYALELGDVLWYLHEACRLLGLTVGQVKRLNVMKLQRRREKAFFTDGPLYGKDPKGELAEAVAILSEPPTAETKPVECMQVHSYAEGCPLVCGTPTKCGADGCARSQGDEFQPCIVCGDLTRHRELSGYTNRQEPLCRAPACRS